MPISAKQPTSAKSTISAKTPPAQGTVGRNAGQKVKEEPQTPPALQKLPVKPLNMKNNEKVSKMPVAITTLLKLSFVNKDIT